MPTYATFNPADKLAGVTLSNGNKTLTFIGGTTYGGARVTIGKTTGKHYVEITLDGCASHVGIGSSIALLNTYCGDTNAGWAVSCCAGNSGSKIYNNVKTAYFGADIATLSVMGIAFDLDAKKVWFSDDGSWGAGGNPGAGTGEAFSGLSGELFIMAVAQNGAGQVTLNAGESAFAGTVPTGFNAGLTDEDIYLVTETAATLTLTPSATNTVELASPTEGEIYFEYGFNPTAIDTGGRLKLTVIGGVLPLTWSVVGAGFSLDSASTGNRENFINADATVAIGDVGVITVTDANGESVEGYVICCTVTVCCTDPAYSFVAGSNVTAVVGISKTVQAVGGCPPYTWTVATVDLSFLHKYTNIPENSFVVNAGEEGGSGVITCTDGCTNAVNMTVTVAAATSDSDSGVEESSGGSYTDPGSGSGSVGEYINWDINLGGWIDPSDDEFTGDAGVGDGGSETDTGGDSEPEYEPPLINPEEGDPLLTGGLDESPCNAISGGFSELLLDGSMDSGSLLWEKLSGTGTCARSSDFAYDGTYSLKVSLTGGDYVRVYNTVNWSLASDLGMVVELFFYTDDDFDHIGFFLYNKTNGNYSGLYFYPGQAPQYSKGIWNYIVFTGMSFGGNWLGRLMIHADTFLSGGTGSIYVDKMSVKSNFRNVNFSNGIPNGNMCEFNVWQPTGTLICRRSIAAAFRGGTGWRMDSAGTGERVLSSAGAVTVAKLGYLFAYIKPSDTATVTLTVADGFYGQHNTQFVGLSPGEWHYCVMDYRIKSSSIVILVTCDSDFLVDNIGLI
uniref:Putative tail protein n=1 Tax=viral metagenome TaxID=1070528 RepID=A0A6M3JBV7_9ZZZZ